MPALLRFAPKVNSDTAAPASTFLEEYIQRAFSAAAGLARKSKTAPKRKRPVRAADLIDI